MDPVANLVVGMENMGRVPMFNVSDTTLPWRMAVTGYVDGARFCFLDFWTHSMSLPFMHTYLNEDGTEVNVRWGLLRPFVTAERMLDEFGLADERDPRVAAYNETTELILAANPGDSVIYSNPQVVELPFAVEASIETEIVWGHGDEFLRNAFFLDGLPAQMMPFLRIVMRSQSKAVAKAVRKGSSATKSARDWATPPPSAGGGGYPPSARGRRPPRGGGPPDTTNPFDSAYNMLPVGPGLGTGPTYADVVRAAGASPEQARAAAQEMSRATARAKAVKRPRLSPGNDQKPAAERTDNSTAYVTPGRDDAVAVEDESVESEE